MVAGESESSSLRTTGEKPLVSSLCYYGADSVVVSTGACGGLLSFGKERPPLERKPQSALNPSSILGLRPAIPRGNAFPLGNCFSSTPFLQTVFKWERANDWILALRKARKSKANAFIQPEACKDAP